MAVFDMNLLKNYTVIYKPAISFPWVFTGKMVVFFTKLQGKFPLAIKRKRVNF
jgi:hypothetical protein